MTFFTSEEERDMLLFTSRNELRTQAARTRLVTGAITDTILGLSAVGVALLLAWHSRPWWQIGLSALAGVLSIIFAGAGRAATIAALEEQLAEAEKRNGESNGA